MARSWYGIFGSGYEHALPPWEEKGGMSVWLSTTTTYVASLHMDQGNNILPVMLVRLVPDSCLVGSRTTVELFDSDNWNVSQPPYHRLRLSSISIHGPFTSQPFPRTSADPYSLRFTSLTGPLLVGSTTSLGVSELLRKLPPKPTGQRCRRVSGSTPPYQNLVVQTKRSLMPPRSSSIPVRPPLPTSKTLGGRMGTTLGATST